MGQATKARGEQKRRGDNFPLFLRSDGRWAKTIAGRTVYFGRDKTEALAKYHRLIGGGELDHDKQRLKGRCSGVDWQRQDSHQQLGTTFPLRAIVQDIRDSAAIEESQGVFAAYLNATYDSSLVCGPPTSPKPRPSRSTRSCSPG